MGFRIREGIWRLGLEGGARKGDLTRIGPRGEIGGCGGGPDGRKGSGESKDDTKQT